jgi:hypothetical protein
MPFKFTGLIKIRPIGCNIDIMGYNLKDGNII